MGRPLKAGDRRRIQLRIDPQNTAVFDSYTADEVSDLMNRALATMTPGIDLGPCLPAVVRPPEPVTPTIARIYKQGSTIFGKLGVILPNPDETSHCSRRLS